MEQSAQDCAGPLFGLPPFGLFSLLFILWDGFWGDTEVDDGKEELAPGDEAILALLMGMKIDDDGGLVCLEDEVEHGGDLGCGGGCGGVQHACCDGDEDGEDA